MKAETLKQLLDAAESAADWLGDTTPGTDQFERGQKLYRAIAKAKAELSPTQAVPPQPFPNGRWT